MASILALSGGPPAHISCGRSIEPPGSDIHQPALAGGVVPVCGGAERDWAVPSLRATSCTSTALARLFRTRTQSGNSPGSLQKGASALLS